MKKIVLGGLTVLMASGRYACLSFKIDFFQGWLDLLLWIGPRKAYHDVNLKPGLINPTIFQNRMQNLHAECTVLNLCRNQTNVTESWHTHTYIYIYTPMLMLYNHSYNTPMVYKYINDLHSHPVEQKETRTNQRNQSALNKKASRPPRLVQ